MAGSALGLEIVASVLSSASMSQNQFLGTKELRLMMLRSMHCYLWIWILNHGFSHTASSIGANDHLLRLDAEYRGRSSTS